MTHQYLAAIKSFPNIEWGTHWRNSRIRKKRNHSKKFFKLHQRSFCHKESQRKAKIINWLQIKQCNFKRRLYFSGTDELLQGLHNKKIFSTIDLKQGYYQLKFEEESIKYTAFLLPFGCYEFRIMPFGLMNAPKSFQKAMVNVLGHLEYVKIYLDDVLIASETESQHVEHVNNVLKKLNTNGFAISVEKSTYGKTEVKFLGRLISENGTKAYLEIKLSIANLKWPKTLKQLQKRIGE